MSNDLDQLQKALQDTRNEAKRLFEVYDRQRTQEHLLNFMDAKQIYQGAARIFWEAYRKYYPKELGYIDEHTEG